jgi:hypothetical protein
MADVKRAKKEANNMATTAAWAIIFTVLRDKENYSLEDLRRVWGHVEDLSGSIIKGYCTIADLRDILKTEESIELTGE